MAETNISTIERPYDNYLFRSEQINTNGNVETQPVKSEGGLNDIWIDTYMRSTNWLPKTRGFYIDGQTGYAEFANVTVTGTIIGAFIKTSNGPKRVEINGTTNEVQYFENNQVVFATSGGGITFSYGGSEYAAVYADPLGAGIILSADTGKFFDFWSDTVTLTDCTYFGPTNVDPAGYTDLGANTTPFKDIWLGGTVYTKNILTTITGTGGWSGDIVPDYTNTRSIGNGSKYWQNAYINGGTYLENLYVDQIAPKSPNSGQIGDTVNNTFELIVGQRIFGMNYFSVSPGAGIVPKYDYTSTPKGSDIGTEDGCYYILERGTGYNSNGTNIATSSGSGWGSGLRVSYEVDGSGHVSNISFIDNAGTGYVSGETVTISGGGNGDATFTWYPGALRFRKMFIKDIKCTGEVRTPEMYSYLLYSTFITAHPDATTPVNDTIFLMDPVTLHQHSGTPTEWPTPGAPTFQNGTMYYDTSTNKLRTKVSGAWTDIATGSVSSTLSSLTIDVSKDWSGYSISNLGNVTAANFISYSGYANVSSLQISSSTAIDSSRNAYLSSIFGNYLMIYNTSYINWMMPFGGSPQIASSGSHFAVAYIDRIGNASNKVTVHCSALSACPLPVTTNALSKIKNLKHKKLAMGVGHYGDSLDYLDIPDAPAEMKKIFGGQDEIVETGKLDEKGEKIYEKRHIEPYEDIDIIKTVSFLYSCVKEMGEEIENLKAQLAKKP